MEGAPSSTADAEVTLLLAGFGPVIAEELSDLGARVLKAATSEAAIELLNSQRISVLCLGDQLQGQAAKQLLTEGRPRLAELGTVQLVLAAGDELALFQTLIDNDELYFLSRRPPPRRELRNLIESALRHQRLPARGLAGHED